MAEPLHIRWHPPLAAITGRETTLALDGPVRVGDFLHRLCAAVPAVARFVHVNPDDGAVTGLLVLVGDTLLKPSDTVAPGSAVEILVAIDGG